MSVLKRRSRMVSFRLSEKEYETMMVGCIKEGSRSLSEFARSAAYERAVGGKDPEIGFLKDRVEELDRRVRDLTMKLANGSSSRGRRAGDQEQPTTPMLASGYRKEG